MSEEIKQIKQTLETWQHIVDFGYGTIEIPNETKIFKTIINLIDKQQKEIEDLKYKLENVAKIRKCFIEIYNDNEEDNEDI